MSASHIVEFATHGVGYYACKACATLACSADPGAAAFLSENATKASCELHYEEVCTDVPKTPKPRLARWDSAS